MKVFLLAYTIFIIPYLFTFIISVYLNPLASFRIRIGFELSLFLIPVIMYHYKATRKRLILIVLFSIVALRLCYYAIEPRLNKNLTPYTPERKKHSFKLGDLAFLKNVQLLDRAGNPLNPAVIKNKVVLLDFYFTSCLPCKQKEKKLYELSRYFNKKDVLIIKIDNGSFDSFDRFNEEQKQNYIASFYDVNGNLSKYLDIHQFPSELLFSKQGETISYTIGFIDDSNYLKQTIPFIEKALSH
jgi:thiol-disulfide isomerase/thioredoxin